MSDLEENIKKKAVKHYTKNQTNKKIIPVYPERLSFINGLMEKDISKRLGCGNELRGYESQIKTHPYFATIDWVLVESGKIEPKFVPAVFIVIDTGQ